MKRLIIHRFRGIRQGVVNDLGKVNFLIGPNNSGKSAILEMLYLSGTSRRECEAILGEQVFQATTLVPMDFLGYPPLTRLRERHGLPARMIGPEAVMTSEGGVEITLSRLPESHSLHNFRLASPLPAPGEPDRTFQRSDLEQIALFSLTQPVGLPADLIPSSFSEQGVVLEESRWHALWHPEWVYQWDQQDPVDRLAIWAESLPASVPSRVLFFDAHTAYRHFSPHFANWAYYHIPDWYEKIASSLVRVFPLLQGAKVEIVDSPQGQEGKTGYVRFPGKTPLPVDYLGDGARHTFKLFASLIALVETPSPDHPALFLWEDPELFMHPASLGRMLDEVFRLIADAPVQVFITTQSLEVLAWLIRGVRKETLPISPSDICTHILGLKDGLLRAGALIGEGVANWFELTGDPRMVGEDEMDSPLAWLLYSTERSE